MDTVVQHEFVKADSVNPNPVASGLYFYLDPEVFVSDPHLTEINEAPYIYGFKSELWIRIQDP